MKEAKEMGTQVCSNISHLTNGYSIASPFFHFLLPGPFITHAVRQNLKYPLVGANGSYKYNLYSS